MLAILVSFLCLLDVLLTNILVTPIWIIGNVGSHIIQGFCIFVNLVSVLTETRNVVQSLNSEGSDNGQSKSYGLFNVALSACSTVYVTIDYIWLNIVQGMLFVIMNALTYFCLLRGNQIETRSVEAALMKHVHAVKLNIIPVI